MTFEIYNPHNKLVEELPYIIGFHNGGRIGWFMAMSIAQDGELLGSHVCSSEYYMPYDLGLIEESHREDRRETYRTHYPNGYRTKFVPYSETCPVLHQALKLNEIEANNRKSIALGHEIVIETNGVSD